MSTFLTRGELAELVGCEPRSLACMRRWLDRNKWPYATNVAGVPQVVREYFVERMCGRVAPAASLSEMEPDFSALDA